MYEFFFFLYCKQHIQLKENKIKIVYNKIPTTRLSICQNVTKNAFCKVFIAFADQNNCFSILQFYTFYNIGIFN